MNIIINYYYYYFFILNMGEKFINKKIIYPNLSNLNYKDLFLTFLCRYVDTVKKKF